MSCQTTQKGQIGLTQFIGMEKSICHLWVNRTKEKQGTDPEVMKLFSSSAQLSMKLTLLINAEIVKNCGKFRFKTQKLVIYPAHKC